MNWNEDLAGEEVVLCNVLYTSTLYRSYSPFEWAVLLLWIILYFFKYYFHYYPLQVLYHYEVVFWLEASLWKLIGLFACWFYSKDSISNTFSGDMWNHSASCTYALYWGHINVSWHIHLHMAEIKENHKKVMVH